MIKLHILREKSEHFGISVSSRLISKYYSVTYSKKSERGGRNRMRSEQNKKN
jgi:hypothetical protein